MPGDSRFFDRIATREGYVNGASWFRTHPPYQRMGDTRQEIILLPDKPELCSAPPRTVGITDQ